MNASLTSDVAPASVSAGVVPRGGRPIRVLALMEAHLPVGPAKNLVEFAHHARSVPSGKPSIEIALATFVRGGEKDNPFIAFAKKLGVQVFRLCERYRFDTSVAAQLCSIAREYRPDILQTHNVKSHFLVRYLRLYQNYPWVAFNHGYTSKDLKDRLYNLFDRWSLRRAHQVVAVCEAFAIRLNRYGISRECIAVQHNYARPYIPPEQDALAATRRELGGDSRPVLICVGRLSREKGHADLIAAAALLRENRPDLRFQILIIGDGPERRALLSQSRRMLVDDAIRFAGFKSELASYYAVAEIFVLPSHSEGSPNVVLEAMSASLPIVATGVGGVPELLENERTALVVPAHHPVALAEAIAKLLDDPGFSARVAAAALNAVKPHNLESYALRMASLYQHVLHRVAIHDPCMSD